jgi:fibronectin-binding autotransporter adhesin
LVASARAQFTGDNETNTISGVASNWPGDYDIGFGLHHDALIIESGGILSNANVFLGYFSGDDNNLALVTGPGSVWSNTLSVNVGLGGAGNQLIVTNGGIVFNTSGRLGQDVSGSNNLVIVTGSSVWTNRSYLDIGYQGGGNRLTVTDGGKVFNLDGTVGFLASSSNNVVIVAGIGSIWENRFNPDLNSGGLLVVGNAGAGNQLIVTNGGKVFSSEGHIGGNDNNVAIVTGAGSEWNNVGGLLRVGSSGASNQLIVTDGGLVVSYHGAVGYVVGASNNVASVSGIGATWQIRDELTIGHQGATNTLNIGIGGSVIAGDANIGLNEGADGSRLNITGGSLYVTNTFGDRTLSILRGTLTFDGGNIVADQLRMTNGPSGAMVFHSGVLNTVGAGVSNGQPFVVGDGAGAATYHLLGGVHSFNDGLRIRNAASLTGCGTINGIVVVDTGGTVLANCSPLVFAGSVTNNGTMRAINGSVLEAYGDVVNNGVLDLITGTTNFHGAFINAGTILTSNDVRAIEISKSGNDINVRAQTYTGHNFQLQQRDSLTAGSWADIPGAQAGTGGVLTFPDLGGATNVPVRFYRVRCSP